MFHIRLNRLAAVGVATFAFAASAHAQHEPVNGMRPADLRTHAVTNATIVPRPGERIENGTIIVRNGVIDAIGPGLDVPRDARVWDAEGLTIYPGFIDAAVLSKYELPADRNGAHWNNRVHPELRVFDQSTPSDSLRKQLRSLGFTAAAIYPEDGDFRGTGAVYALADDDKHVVPYDEAAAMMLGFDYGGGWSSATYPGSLMGAIALLRQTLYDAQWYAACQRVYENNPQGNEPPEQQDALAALRDVIEGRQRVLFDTTNELNALRAARIAKEFDLDLMLLGSGTEFRRLQEIVDLGAPLIVPLDYPKQPKVSTLHQANNTSLREMLTWEQAPTNARRLVEAGATVALTTQRLKKRSDFIENLRNAIKHGLSQDDALACVTTTPARLLGLNDVMGTLENGKLANFVIVKGDLFDHESDDKPKVRDVWINGRRHEVNAGDTDIKLAAKGRLTTDLGVDVPVEIDTTKKSLKIELPPTEEAERKAQENDKEAKPRTIKAKKVTVQRDQVAAVIDGEAFYARGYVHLSGVITDGDVVGTGMLPDGTRFTFDIESTGELDDDKEDEKKDNEAAVVAVDDADANDSPIAGTWTLDLEIPGASGMSMVLDLEQEDATVSGTLNFMGNEIDLDNGTFDPATGELRFETSDRQGGTSSIVGTVDGDNISGVATQSGMEAAFTGSRDSGDELVGSSGKKKDKAPFVMPPDELVTPLGAYGLAEEPQQQNVLITNATIWTCGPDGVIENGWMLVADGVIEAIGSGNLGRSADGAEVIDAAGRHVTPGLLDCHSHTGIDGGVNEWTQVNTAEVRIADCIDPDDINWYRQLAGGLTIANQLHGSANPIGGQNSVVKLKWGGRDDDYRVKDAIGGIKFALGENVKRTRTRYPNTRMGVETSMRDAFTAAKEYDAKWRRHLDLSSSERAHTMPPRRDLELDALVEIINGERLVHCHSYRQDEILMLIRLADSFGFTIGTFQHILEGYKVADAIAEHGAGGSSFSDWWAYKVEVMDAIPHNGSLMTEVGVLMSFNSDSSELARRMNTEASKAVRYGGMEPSEALKLVTINPAKQLRIDHRVGSLEVGKDADFVIWSGDPLSTYTRCDETWIEGARYYSRELDEKLAQQASDERQRLLQKLLAQSHGEADSTKEESDDDSGSQPTDLRRMPRAYAWQIDHARAWMAEQVRLGHDPEQIQPGVCGCNDFIWQLMGAYTQK